MGDDAGAPAPAEPDAASLMAIRMAEHQLQSGLQHPGQQLGGGMLDSVREAGPDFSGVLGHMAGMAGIMAGMPGVAWPGVVNGPGWPVGPAGVHSIQAPGGRQRPGSGAQAGKRKAGGGEEPANEGEEEGDDDGGDGGGEEGGGGAGSAGGPADEKEERRLRRLLRNRVSAQQARERKKTYLKEIENHTSMLEASVAALEQRVQSLERENAMLRQLLKSSSATAGGAGSSALQPGWLEVEAPLPDAGL